MAASDAMFPVPMHKSDSSNVSTAPNSSSTDLDTSTADLDANASISSAEASTLTTDPGDNNANIVPEESNAPTADPAESTTSTTDLDANANMSSTEATTSSTDLPDINANILPEEAKALTSDPVGAHASIAPDELTTSIIDLSDINAISSVTAAPLSFATSNYKRLYTRALAPPLHDNLVSAVENMLTLYAQRICATEVRPDGKILEWNVNAAMEQMQDQAFTLSADVGAMVQYLWTSSKKHRIVKDMEWAAVLNAVIRDDVAEEIEAAGPIFRSMTIAANINIRCYPRNGETWRGGGFRREYRAFFERMITRKYRVPGYLATSDNRQIAAAFAFKAGTDHPSHPCVIWRIMFDPRGKLNAEYRVKHMTFVSKTSNPGENEYLFAPYSVFALVSVKWSVKELIFPHEFTIRAALDNKEEDEELPLTPWY